MKRRIALWISCFFFTWALGSPPGFSEEASAGKAWTLEECIQIALKNRPEIEFSTLDILQAEHQIKEATSYYYPKLNLTASYTHFNRPLEFEATIDLTEIKNNIQPPFNSQIPNSIQQFFEIGKTNWTAFNLDLIQPVYTFGRIKEGVNQARIGRSIAVNQKEKKKTEIAYEVKKGYYQFLMAREILRLLKEAEVGTQVVAQMVKIAYETAVPEGKEEKGTTRLDYLKALNFHAEVKAKLSEADKNFKLAQLGLKMAMGLYGDAPVNVGESPLETLPMTLWNVDDLKGRSLENNIDLKSLELGVQFFDSKRKAASKEYFPKVGLFGNYVGPEDRYGNSNVWFAGVGLTMPLLDGFLTKAKVGQAEAQFKKIKGQKALLEAALSVQMDSLHTTLTELKERAVILQSSIKEAKERAQLAADGYASGITEYEELLLAQKAAIELQAGYLQSLFLFQMTKSEIEFVSRIQ
jgi:outer membrane protein